MCPQGSGRGWPARMKATRGRICSPGQTTLSLSSLSIILGEKLPRAVLAGDRGRVPTTVARARGFLWADSP